MAQQRDPLLALQDGTRSKRSGDKFDYTYYDTATLAVATTSHRLFTQQLGGAKTLADTNMKVGSQIPSGQKLIVHALKIDYIGKTTKATADLLSYYNMLDQTTLQIILSGKDDYGTFRLTELMGAHQYLALTPTAAGDNIDRVQAIAKGVFPFNVPITLAALQTFEILITHQTAVAAALATDRLVVGLNGKLIRLS
jgi:hypothetical protein